MRHRLISVFVIVLTSTGPLLAQRLKGSTDPQQVANAYNALRMYGVRVASYQTSLPTLDNGDDDPDSRLRIDRPFLLTFPGKLSSSDLPVLLPHCAKLPNLGGLDFGKTSINDNAIRNFEPLADIEVLYLDQTAIGDNTLEAISKAKKLRWLDLSQTRITDAGLKHLAQLEQLHTLNLSHCKITDAGLANLTKLSRLRVLNLSNTGITLANISVITDMKKLRHLILDRTAITDDALNALANHPSLQRLSLQETAITGSGLKHLAGATNLRELELQDCLLNDDGLAGVGTLSQIFRLDLSNTTLPTADPKKGPRANITDQGVQHLAGCKSLTMLRLNRLKINGIGLAKLNDLAHLAELHLEQCPIADLQLIGLSKWKKLRTLNLTKTPLTGDGLHHLAEIATLETVILDGSKVTDAGLKKMCAAKDLLELSLRETQITGNVPELKELRSLARLDVSQTKVNDVISKHLSQVNTLQVLVVAETGFSSVGYRVMLKTTPDCRIIMNQPKTPVATPVVSPNVARPSRLPVFTD